MDAIQLTELITIRKLSNVTDFYVQLRLVLIYNVNSGLVFLSNEFGEGVEQRSSMFSMEERRNELLGIALKNLEFSR